jgi:hypothetical protein
MKTELIILFFLFSNVVHSQEDKKINLFVGTSFRVTPIYTNGSPQNLIRSINGNLNAVQQPDKYISGLGLLITQSYKIQNNWSLIFQQTLRNDILYEEWPLDRNLPYAKMGEKNKFTFNLNLDICRTFKNKKHEFTALFGFGISGLNANYTQTIRQYNSATDFVDQKEKINLTFPTVSTAFGWQKGKFLTHLRIGYCWKNPTWFTYSFLYPEISVQYQIK